MSFFCQYQKVVSYIWRVSEDEDTVNDEEDDDEDSSDLRRNTSNSWGYWFTHKKMSLQTNFKTTKKTIKLHTAKMIDIFN